MPVQLGVDCSPAVHFVLGLKQRPPETDEVLPLRLGHFCIQNLAPPLTHLACYPFGDVVQVTENHQQH